MAHGDHLKYSGKPKAGKKTFLRLISYVACDRRLLIVIGVLIVISIAANLTGSYMLRPIINDYILPGDFQGLVRILLFLAAIYLTGVAATYIEYILLNKIGQRTVTRMREELFGKMERLPVRYFDTHQHGDVMSRYTNDIDRISDALTDSLSDMLSSALTVIGIFCLMIFISLLVLVCMAPLAFLLAAVFANRMYRPIDTLVSSMNLVTRGNLDTKIEIRAHDSDEMRLVSSVFNWMIARIQTLIENAREESERKKNAELKALQAQISPHFLYNMLNEINALARMGRTGEVSGFVIHLGKLLRRSITFKDDFVKLSDDLVFVEDYIRLQQIRYDQLFDVDIRVEEEIRDCLIPNLIIQPLVENAIIHGFTAGKEGYMLSLRGYRREEDVCIEIYDNGIGVDKEYLKYINNVEKGVGLYGGLGVENVQKRLLLIYGMRYGIKMESEKGRYTKVVILLPYRREQVDKT